MASDLDSVAKKIEGICRGGVHKLHSGRMGRLPKGAGRGGAIGGVGIGSVETLRRSLLGKGLDSVVGGENGSGEMLRKSLVGRDDLGLGDDMSSGKTMKKSFVAKLDAALGEVGSAEAMRQSLGLGLGLAMKGNLSLGGKIGNVERMGKSSMGKGDLSLSGEKLSKSLGGKGNASVGVGFESEEKVEYDLEIPMKLMQEAEGHTVMVEFKSGDKYHGTLVECDDSWNCQLENAAYTSKVQIHVSRNNTISTIDHVNVANRNFIAVCVIFLIWIEDSFLCLRYCEGRKM